MKKLLSKNDPMSILEFLIESSIEKIVQKYKQRKIEYVMDIATSANDKIFDTTISFAHQRLYETEIMLSSILETLNKIDEMETEELLQLLDKMLLVIHGCGLKDEEHSKIRDEINKTCFSI